MEGVISAVDFNLRACSTVLQLGSWLLWLLYYRTYMSLTMTFSTKPMMHIGIPYAEIKEDFHAEQAGVRLAIGCPNVKMIPEGSWQPSGLAHDT